MPKITFLPQNITIDAQTAAPLLEAARLAGVSVESPCGGKGVCRKCLVKIISGKIDVKSGSYRDTKENHALICQSNVADEDLTIEILTGLYGEEGKFDDVSEISNISDIDNFIINPLVKRIDLQVSKPATLDGLSDLDRLKKALKLNIPESFADIKIPLNILSKLPVEIRKNNGEVRIFYYIDCGILQIVDITDIIQNTEMYGIAVDIGTTAVTLWLVDMITGEIKSRKTDYNAQIECGLDIITRINYAQKNLNELKKRILLTINNLIKISVYENNIEYNKIYCASIAGNTVMTHLLLGICPEYIRLDPYTPAVFKTPLYNASDIGIGINQDAPIKIAPSVGSYVGGDITAGALCTPLCENKSEIILFLDVGTNGEILLGNNEFILGCACSAGPAFEGGGIEFGMRASKGAIDNFEIGGDGEINIRTIDNAPPIGICGSGIISIIGEMFKHKIIDAAGRFTDNTDNINKPQLKEKIKKDKKPHRFYITDEITVSEADIDNLIRAKGAMFSACRTLLNSMELTFGDIDKIYIAGGFGKYLNIANAKAIGLLPNIPEEKIVFTGNTSVFGAYQVLLSEKKHDKMHEIADMITYIDLSSEPGYMDEYLAALFIPHTDTEAGMFEHLNI